MKESATIERNIIKSKFKIKEKKDKGVKSEIICITRKKVESKEMK